jgi:prepilin-type N-terminal cleavage/methylation domain-containing protein
MKTNLEKGFTILEVLVAMAIVGMLIAAAAFGISAVQRNSRDARRKELAQQVKIGYEDYYGNYGIAPTNIVYDNSTDPSTVTFNDGTTGKQININVPTFSAATSAVALNAAGCTAGNETDRDNVAICVSSDTTTRGDILVNLESTASGFAINN